MLSWKTLTLGHLSRNKFWGESDNAQYHSIVATTTFIHSEGKNILVDPSLPVEEMGKLLKLHCDLSREDIHIIYATHYHADHRVDVGKYPNATVYMSAGSLADGEAEKERVNRGQGIPAFAAGLEIFKQAPESLAPNVRLYPMPGHTDGNTGLMLETPEGRVLIAGDTIMGEEYFCAGEGYWFNADAQKTHDSILNARDNADIVIPGHGDWFLTKGRMDIGKAPGGCRWYRLNLGSTKEEIVVLLCQGDRKILVNPSLPGHLLRNALFDRIGLELSDITHVLCLDGEPRHRLDLETMKNAAYLMPADILEHQRQKATKDISLHLFHSFEAEEFPELELLKGITGNYACLFEGPEGIIVVGSYEPVQKVLETHRPSVMICGSQVKSNPA